MKVAEGRLLHRHEDRQDRPRAPFTQTLTVKATAKAGSKLTVRARAHIKVKRGKSPKKSIVSSITVCP